MKRTGFLAIALLAISFLLYLNFFSKRQPGFMHTAIYTDKAPKPIGPYSQAVLTGNTLFVAGQIAIHPVSGNMDTASITAETERVLDNIRAILEAAKMGPSNMVKTTIYLTDLADFKTVNEVYNNFLIKHHHSKETSIRFPARETVQVAGLPKGAHVEISVVAVK